MKICLIGSTQFLRGYQELTRKLTLAGHIVYTVSMVNPYERGEVDCNLAPEDKETLDLVHLRKIVESDAVVLVTNKARYIGDSTRRELKWAGMLGKELYLPGDKIVPVHQFYSLTESWENSLYIIPEFEAYQYDILATGKLT